MADPDHCGYPQSVLSDGSALCDAAVRGLARGRRCEVHNVGFDFLYGNLPHRAFFSFREMDGNGRDWHYSGDGSRLVHQSRPRYPAIQERKVEKQAAYLSWMKIRFIFRLFDRASILPGFSQKIYDFSTKSLIPTLCLRKSGNKALLHAPIGEPAKRETNH